jgi:hypothetical protein
MDRLDRVEQIERPSCLVGLERTDEVPCRARHLRGLCLRLLDPVLAEDRQPRGDRRRQPLCRHGLRHGDERHLDRIAPNPLRRTGNALEDAHTSGAKLLDVRRDRGAYFLRRKLGISRSSAS